MAGEQEFDSVVPVQSMDSTQVAEKNYDIETDDFQTTDSWFAKFYQYLPIEATMTMVKNFVATFSDSITMSVNDMVTQIRNSMLITLVTKLESRMSFSQKMGTALFLVTEELEAIMRLKERMANSEIYIDMKMEVAPVFAQYYHVSDWDASLLSDLDAYNLSQMDYQVV